MSTLHPKPGPAFVGAVLAAAFVFTVASLLTACNGDDTTPTYLGLNDASPPRLGPQDDAGTE